MIDEYLVSRSQKTYGPYTMAELQQMAARCQLLPDDMVRRRDLKFPSPASEIEGLFQEQGQRRRREELPAPNKSRPPSQSQSVTRSAKARPAPVRPVPTIRPVPAVSPAVEDSLIPAAFSPMEPIEIRCPDCLSENCQRIEMAYNLGTSRSAGIASSFFSGGVGGMDASGLGFTTMSGSSQSNFAAMVAPPIQMSTTMAVIGMILGSIFLLIAFAFIGGLLSMRVKPDVSEGGFICLALPLLLGIVLTFVSVMSFNKASKFNRHKWPRLYDSWRRKFACLKCGKIWIPEHLQM